MNTRFFDLQDRANPLNGCTITNAVELRKVLASVRDRPPFVASLECDNGFMLTIGIALTEGTVQFSPTHGAGPYFMAVNPDAAELESDGETFLLGGTATTMEKRYCLPYDQFLEILDTFVQTCDRSKRVTWVEI